MKQFVARRLQGKVGAMAASRKLIDENRKCMRARTGVPRFAVLVQGATTIFLYEILIAARLRIICRRRTSPHSTRQRDLVMNEKLLSSSISRHQTTDVKREDERWLVPASSK